MEDYHTFIPSPGGMCLICDTNESAPCHRRTRASAHRDSLLLSKSKSNRNVINDTTTSTTPNQDEKEDDDEDTNSTSNSTDQDNNTDAPTSDIDSVTDIYTWGECSRLGPCKNKYSRPNSDHKDAQIRKTPGTHLWSINRSTHSTAFTIPLELDGIPRSKTVIQMAASDKHTLLVTDCGQVHAFKQSVGKHAEKENIITRIYLRTQVFMVGCGTSHFIALASLSTNNLLAWGMNNRGQLGIPIKGKEGDRTNKKNIVSAPTPLELNNKSLNETNAKSTSKKSGLFSLSRKSKSKSKSKSSSTSRQLQETINIDDKVPPFVAICCGPMSTFAIGSDGRVWSWGFDGKQGVLGHGRLQLHDNVYKWRYRHEQNYINKIEDENNAKGGIGKRRSSFLRHRSSENITFGTKEEPDEDEKDASIQEKKNATKKKVNSTANSYLPSPNMALMTFLNMSMYQNMNLQNEHETTLSYEYKKKKKKKKNNVEKIEMNEESNDGREGYAKTAMFKRAYDGWNETYCRKMVETARLHPTEWSMFQKKRKKKMKTKNNTNESNNKKEKKEEEEEEEEEDVELLSASFRLEKVLDESEKIAWKEQDDQRTIVEISFKGDLKLKLENRAIANIIKSSRSSRRNQRGNNRRKKTENESTSNLVASVLEIGTDNLSQKIDPTTIIQMISTTSKKNSKHSNSKKKEIKNPDKKVKIFSIVDKHHNKDSRVTLKRAKKILKQWNSLNMKIVVIQNEQGINLSKMDPTKEEVHKLLQENKLQLLTIKFREMDHFDKTFNLTSLYPQISFGALPEGEQKLVNIPDVPIGTNVPSVAVRHGWIVYALHAFWYIQHMNGVLPLLTVEEEKKEKKEMKEKKENEKESLAIKKIYQMKQKDASPITIIRHMNDHSSKDNDLILQQQQQQQRTNLISEDAKAVLSLHSDLFGKNGIPLHAVQVQRLRNGDIITIGTKTIGNRDEETDYKLLPSPKPIIIRFLTSIKVPFCWTEYDQTLLRFQRGRGGSSSIGRTNKGASVPPRKPYLNPLHMNRMIQKSIVAASIQNSQNNQNNIQKKKKNQNQLMKITDFGTTNELNTSNGFNTSKTSDNTQNKEMQKEIEEDINPLRELTVKQRKQIALLSTETNCLKLELIEIEELILDIRQRPGTVSIERKNKKRDGSINNLIKNAIMKQEEDTMAVVNIQTQKNKNVDQKKKTDNDNDQEDDGLQERIFHSESKMKTISQKDRYEKDTTKNGAIQLVHNKEVQMTQHSIAIRQLHSEIMHYKTKIKEEEITLQQNMYMVSKLRQETEGIQLEIEALPVTDKTVVRLEKQVKVRNDMLQSRQTFHTSIAASIGNLHEKVMQKTTLIQKNQTDQKDIGVQIGMLNNLIVEHDVCLRHDLIRKPNVRLIGMMDLAKSTLEKLSREDANEVLGHDGVVKYLEQTNAGYHRLLNHSTVSIQRILKDIKLMFEKDYFSGNDMLRNIAETVLQMLVDNGEARIRRNLFTEGLIIQKSNESHRIHEDIVNDILETHRNDSEIQRNRLKPTERGY